MDAPNFMTSPLVIWVNSAVALIELLQLLLINCLLVFQKNEMSAE